MSETDNNTPIPKPDAIIVPLGWLPPGGKNGADLFNWLREQLGGQPWIRNQDSEYFVTTCPHDVIFHHIGHPRQGESRYHWYMLPNGARFGSLTADAWKGDLTGIQRAQHHEAIKTRMRAEVPAVMAEITALSSQSLGDEGKAHLEALRKYAAWANHFSETEEPAVS